MPTPRSIQRTYLLLLLGNTLAASFIWGINTILLLDAGLSNLEAFAANAFITAGMLLFEVPTGIVDGYVEAFESADVSAIAAMLADDATLAMPPLREWYAGRDVIAASFGDGRLKPGNRCLVPPRANGQPAAAHYVWDREAQAFLPHSIHVLALEGDRIREITVFLAPVS
jgi:hypothetical protein